MKKWLALIVDNQLVAHKGLGPAIGRCLGLFCTDNGVVVLWDPEWLQGTLNSPIGILCWYGLVENVFNSKATIFHPGTLMSGMLEEEVGWR